VKGGTEYVGSEERIAANPDGQTAASAGVSAPMTGAAVPGVAGGEAGTPPQEAPRPQGVSEEDFKRYQRSMNQQVDMLRNQAQSAAQLSQQQAEILNTLQQELNAKEQEIFKLKTQDLPDDQQERESLKRDREMLARRVAQAEQALKQSHAALSQANMVVQEREARTKVIDLLMEGDSSVGLDGYRQYGLTMADLEQCKTPQEMEAKARAKHKEWYQKQKVDLEKSRAEIAAQKRIETGSTKVDKGEPTGGGSGIPKAGTPEFKAFSQEVMAGRRRL